MTERDENAAFWHGKWSRGEIGFHEPWVQPLLVQHLDALNLGDGARIFVPLCGKSRDMAWLAEQGFEVVGCDLSVLAIRQFFAESDLLPEEAQIGDLTCFSAPNLRLFAGNIFDLSPEMLGPIDAVYDRAALVALPDDLRRAYAAHLLRLSRTSEGCAPQFLITLDYDQACLNGPPFAVGEAFLDEVYGAVYRRRCLERTSIEGGLKGRCPAETCVWALTPEMPSLVTAAFA